MKWTTLIMTGAAMALLSSLVLAESVVGQHGAESSKTGMPQPSTQGRLRFRDGPVCMCSQGMSEEDIQRAQDERWQPRWRRR